MQSQQHQVKPAPDSAAGHIRKAAELDEREQDAEPALSQSPKTRGEGHLLTAGNLLSLQRTYGNRAVQRLIERQRTAPAANIQRNGKETAKKVVSTTGELSDVTGAGLGAAKDIGSLIAEGGRAATGAGVASAVGGTVGAIKELGEAYSEGSKLKGVSGTTGLINAGAGAIGTFGSEAAGAIAGPVGAVTDVVGGGIKAGKGISEAIDWSKAGKSADKLKGQSSNSDIKDAADKLSKIASYKYYLSSWDIGVGSMGAAGGTSAVTAVAAPVTALVTVPLAAGLSLTSKILGADTTWNLLHWVAPNYVWTNARYEQEIEKIENELKAKAEDIIKTANVDDITALYKIAKENDFAKGFAEELVIKIPTASGKANARKRARLRQNLI